MAQNPQQGGNNPQQGGNNPQQGGNNGNNGNGNNNGPTSSRLIIPPSAPAGLLTITQPPQTATSYYKIAPSQTITFGWNFSYVLATPTHLTISAVCDNGNTYAVGPNNGIIPGTATQIAWDIYSYQQNNPSTPLAQATYTLEIWDDRGPNAARAPGYLQENNALRFALYSPQAYTPLSSGWQCTACNSAYSYAAQPIVVGLLATLVIMFLSGFGVLRHIR